MTFGVLVSEIGLPEGHETSENIIHGIEVGSHTAELIRSLIVALFVDTKSKAKVAPPLICRQKFVNRANLHHGRERLREHQAMQRKARFMCVATPAKKSELGTPE